MAYSYFDYEGTDTTIQTDILCVSTEHMYAFKVLSEDESNVTLSDVALAATFTKNNAGVLCELDTAPSTKIRVIRSTPYDVLMHDFSNGAQFNADSVDEVYEQLLYLCQEIVEGKLIIDSSGNFGGTSAGGISQNELQAQLAAQYSLGYSDGEAAGTAAGDAAGYARGYSEGSAFSAIEYNTGYNAGYNAGYEAGSGTGGGVSANIRRRMYTRKRNEYCIQTTVLSTPSTRVRLDVQYLNKNYISVYLNTEILSPYVLGTAEAYLNYRWVDEQTIEFSEELTGVVQFVRTTSLEDNLVKFKESPITADYVDTNNTQLLHIIQEILGGTSDARAYNFEVDGTLMYFDETVERTQMTDAVIQEVQETASTIFGTPIQVVTPDPLSWPASRITSTLNLDLKMVDTTATPDGVVFPKVYGIQTSDEFMAKRTILGNRYGTGTKSLTPTMNTQVIVLEGTYSKGWAINPEGTQYWRYYLNLPAPSTHFRVYTGNVEYIDATTGEWVVLGTTEDIPVLYNYASEFIAYATDKTTYSRRPVLSDINMNSWSATDAQYVYAFDPSATDKINRALDVQAEFYLERRLESANLFMRYYPNETECKFIVGDTRSSRWRGYKFCDTRHLPLEQNMYSISTSDAANDEGSDGNVLNGIAYTAARAQRTEYYDTKNPRTDVITANLRLVPLYKFDTEIRAYYKFVGDPAAAVDFYSAYTSSADYKRWLLEAGQYLDIMLQSVTELNTDWSDELDGTIRDIPIIVGRDYTNTNGYLDNPMDFHNSYVGRGFRAVVPVSTDAGEELLHITFPHGMNYGKHSDSTKNPISNAVGDNVFPTKYYVAAHKSGTVTYNDSVNGHRIPIESIVPEVSGSVENVQKPWYVNAFVRYNIGLAEETDSDKIALLGNPNTVSETVHDEDMIMPEIHTTFPEPTINYPSITKTDSSKTILYTRWGSYAPTYLPSTYPSVIDSATTSFSLGYYGGRAPDVWNIDLIKYNVYDVLPDIDTGKTELLVDATDEETYVGDTVFKKFFMDYVKKLGFYNGS